MTETDYAANSQKARSSAKVLRHLLCAALLLALFLGGVSPAAADSASAPQLPAQIHGTVVDKDGVPLPVGTVITATVDGKEFTYTVKEAGKIGEPGTFGEKFLVQGENAGSTIEFSVNGETAGELPAYTPGKSMEFSLSFPVDADSLQTPATPTVQPSSTPAVPTPTPTATPTVTQTPTPTSTATVTPTQTEPTVTETVVPTAEPTETLPPAGDTGDSPVEVVPTLDDFQYPTDVQTPGFSPGLLVGALALGVFLLRKE